ncbi:zinc carboxypeptidase A 1-like [Chrysoperla carnea]|uniref:zinc carboxypeptidase A 1-like n=1 Tax=Chrysoperla carnea TaxID=189513 RepID=UPI001D07171C|nr:zinc carboxypeptidase A 1-like [Chrysoperla carnea]
MVAPHQQNEFVEILSRNGISFELYIENVQKLIDNEKSLRSNSGFNFENYHRLSVINEYLGALAANNSQVEVVIGGRSYEGRNITGVKVSYKKGNPIILIEGGIHAREWIGPATALYLLTQLLTSKDKNVRHLAEDYDWHIFPSVNPDGYEYTHTSDRMWRKTRQPGKICVGADANRNFDTHWGEEGASDYECDETYAGSKAFSEIEAKTLSEYVDKISKDLHAYISFHSYSQVMLIPYGHTTQHLDNFDDLLQIGEKAVEAIGQRYGTKYEVGCTSEIMYAVSGGSIDWAKAKHKVPITYTYELRDTGRHGFVLPPEQIIPTGEETLDSLLALFKEAENIGYKRHSKMKSIICVLLLTTCVIWIEAKRERYDEYTVYRIKPKNEAQMKLIDELEKNEGLDLWTKVRQPYVDIMISPKQKQRFHEFVDKYNLDTSIFIENVQKLIDEEVQMSKRNQEDDSEFNFVDYHRLDVIYDHLYKLEAQYPGVAKVVTIGKSYEGRNITGLHISRKQNNRTIIIEGGIHAREWIAPATSMFILSRLLNSSNLLQQYLSEQFDWYIFPVVNPDGYEYTHTTSRLWRKTRQPNNGSRCVGTDANRNFDFHWMEIGASSNPCSESYGGASAFSEPETRALSDFIKTQKDTLWMYIGFHSYSQLLLFPYGHTPEHVENNDDLQTIGNAAATALLVRFNTTYTVGPVYETIYATTGITMDWVRGVLGTPLTFTYELRDTGRHGFVLPADQIIPCGEEIVDSVQALISQAEKLGY